MRAVIALIALFALAAVLLLHVDPEPPAVAAGEPAATWAVARPGAAPRPSAASERLLVTSPDGSAPAGEQAIGPGVGPCTEVVVRVVDDRGAPLTGVDVTAEVADTDEPRPLDPTRRKGFTGKDGTVRLLLFDAPFVIGANRRGTLAGLTTETRTVAVGTAPARLDLILRRLAGTLRVELNDDLGVPIHGHTVHIDFEQRKLETGHDGVVTFEDLPVGLLHVWPSGRGSHAVPRPSPLAVELLAGSMHVETYVLPRLAEICCTLTPESHASAATVFITKLESAWRGGGARTTDGSRTSFEVPPGTFLVDGSFGAEDVLGTAAPVRVSVRPGERVEVTLTVQPLPGVVAGVVVDPLGLRVAGARVWVVPEGLLSRFGKSATADAGGAFRVRGIADRPLSVFAEHPGMMTADFTRPELRLPGPAHGVVVQVPFAYTLRALVADGFGLPRLDRTEVRLRRVQDGMGLTWFAEGGEATFTDLRAGAYELYVPNVDGSDRPAHRVDLGEHLAPSRTAEVRLSLP